MRAKSVWRLLQRNQDRVMVGAATTLVMLALLAHARSGFIITDSGSETSLAIDSPVLSPLANIPRDPEFYREKWRQIANDFYKANPVASDEPAAAVITASLSDQNDLQSDLGPKISTVAHTMPAPVIETAVVPTTPATPRRVGLIGPPAVFAALAAGLLATLLYSTLWPTIPSSPNHGLACSDLLRIELPSHWVRIRPTPFQRVRPIVVAASYVGGIAAAWSIISH